MLRGLLQGYFATGTEYDVGMPHHPFMFQLALNTSVAPAGGYESELTLWGYNTSEVVRAACSSVALPLKP